MQDFVAQAESLIYDERLKDAIVANAKQYIEASHNDKDEYAAFSRLSMGMFRSVTRKAVANPGESTDEEERTTRVRFQVGKEKKKKLCIVAVEFREEVEDAVAVDDGAQPTAREETPAETGDTLGGTQERTEESP